MAPKADSNRLDKLVAEARRVRDERDKTYREQALKLFPWICGRCGREFSGANLRMLTVHHKDGNHDNNPPDGGNWELLCVYCHENEHARVLDQSGREPRASDAKAPTMHRPFAALDSLLKDRKA